MDNSGAKISVYDVVIIGGGSTGFSAAMCAGRLNMKTLVLAENIGGTLAVAGAIENWPGIKSVDGFSLVEQIRDHALEYGVRIVEKKAVRAEQVGSGKNSFFRINAEDESFDAKSVIIATGTTVRKLGVPGEEEFANRGVHYCALCDGPLYRGKVLGVVGGSDSAAKEALVLAEYGSQVYIIYRGEQIHPEPVNMKRVLANKKITIINNTNIKEIKGGERSVTSVVFDRQYNGSTVLALDGLFVEIGHIPRSEIAIKLGVAVDKKKEVIIDREAKTNVEGVFAAGDVVDTKFKQAITGAGEAVLAAYSAYSYVSGKEIV